MKKIFALVCLTLLVAGQAVGRNEWREKAAGQSGGATSRGEASSELAEAARLNSEVVKLFAAGKYDEALPLARRVLEIREKALGDNILVVYALNNLASIYTGKGKDGEAEPLFRRSLAVLEKIGAGVSDVAAEVNTRLGVLKLRGGNYKEAEPFLRRSLEILEKGHGADDPSVVPALLNIAHLYLLRRDSAAFIGDLDPAATIINNQPPSNDTAV